MTARPDLEQKIRQKLEAISAHNLQVLAEDIAQVRDPQRYRGLYGMGRNSEAQTTTGWPDAGVVAADGTVDAVEATREKDDWKSHIAADLAHARDDNYPKLNGLLFVAGYPKNRATYEDIGFWKSQFRALGIAEERVDILVGTGLIRELAEPRYARTRLTVLGITDCPSHFKILGAHTTASDHVHSFEPTEKEYALGKVHRPKLTDMVERQLREHDYAFVRGKGAAGKTVMINLIAADPDYKSLPTYYLDLAQWVDRVQNIRGSVENTLTEFGGKGILFVFDNVHLEEDFTNDIFHYWKETASWTGTRILLVGRETRRRGGSLLDKISGLHPLILQAGNDELRGVYRRIVSADRAAKCCDPPDPPAAEVDSWMKTFGGKVVGDPTTADLIAFSAAVRRRKNFLRNKNWLLTEDDAVAEVREHYLAPLGKPEYRNLLRLASLPEDYLLPYSALAVPMAGFKTCINGGIVFESEHGQALHLRYSLAHSALAQLFRVAAQPQLDQAEECCEVARLSPATGISLVKAILADGSESFAKRTLQALPKMDWLRSQSSLGFVAAALKIGAALGVAIFPDEEASQQTVRDAILTIALRPPIESVAVFLRYAERTGHGLSKIRANLIEDLTRQKEGLTQVALQTPLDQLAVFLQYAETEEHGLSVVRRHLIEHLTGQSDSLEKLTEVALQTPLDQLAVFLQYAETEEHGLSVVRRHLIEQLTGQSDNLEKLTQVAFKTPFEKLAFFLQYAEPEKRGLSTVRRHMVKHLNAQKETLSEVAVRTPLPALMSFLQYVPFAKELWDLIDVDAWNKRRVNDAPLQPDFMINLSRTVTGPLARPELAQIPAQIQITKFDPARWRGEGVYINQFSNLIALAGTIDRAQLASFLDRTVTGNWLATNYSRASLGGLAGALFTLARHLPWKFHQRFNAPELDTRIAANSTAEDVGAQANLVSLFGSAAVLVGMRPPKNLVISQWDIAAVIAGRPARNEFGRLSYAAAQFWCGLHDFIRFTDDLIDVPTAQGDVILDAWCDHKPSTVFVAALDQAMVAWLQRCRECKWTLMRPSRSIREVVLDSLCISS